MLKGKRSILVILICLCALVCSNGAWAVTPKTFDRAFECEALLIADRVNKQFATLVVNSSKRNVLDQLNSLYTSWSRAMQTEIRLINQGTMSELDIQEAVKQVQDEIAALVTKHKDGNPEEKIKGILPFYREFAELAEQALVESNFESNIEWDTANTMGWSLLAELVLELNQKFPIDAAFDKGIKYADQAYAVRDSILSNVARIQQNADVSDLFSKTQYRPDGTYVLEFPKMGIRIFVDRQLKTTVIHPNDGLILEKNNFVVSLDGGAGTVNSHAGGWKHLIPLFVSNGMSPVALDPPWSGFKLSEKVYPYTNLEQTLKLMHKRDRWMQSLIKGKTNGGWMPHELIGRSLGSLLDFAHAVFNRPPESDVSAFVLTAFSNPLTFDYQVESLKEQHRAGVVKGLSMPSLMNGKLLAMEILTKLEEMKRTDPDTLAALGDNLLFIQGDVDLDAGEEGEKYLLEFVERYVPRAHVVMIRNFDKSDGNFNEKQEDQTEGSHFLFSNHDKLKDQMVQMNALMYGFRDYLALQSSKLAAYREQRIGKMLWIDWYWNEVVLKSKSSKKRIKEKDFRKADSSERSIPGRVKAVEEYFKSEFERVHGAK